MRKFLKYIFVGILLFLSEIICTPDSVQAKNNNIDWDKIQKIPVFCYHDVVADDAGLTNDPYAVTQQRLEEHFKLFRKEGYMPISMQQYADYVNGKGELPEKPIMLTFDDGRESMYTRIFPLLKKYEYPAVFAIILSYMDKENLPDDIEKMVTWQQLKEMQKSGLVTLASHTYDMHNFIVLNHYGDESQNAGTVLWSDNGYESENNFNNRIDKDMLAGKELLEKNTGKYTNVLVWPYGTYTGYSVKSAKKAGYEYQFMLNDDVKLTDEKLMSRYIIYGNPTNEEIKNMLNHTYPKRNLNAVQLDIDMIYDASAEQFERNIDAAIDKFNKMNANTVFLQTFADEDGNGDVEQVYFHTNRMEVKADVFSHVVSRLKSAGFSVFAWMPVLSYPWMSENPDDAVTASEPDNLGWYTRATPFSPRVRKYARDLVKDLVMYAPIDGILFQDDLYMNDFEDFSPYAKKEFKEKFGKDLTRENLETDTELMYEWTKLKTDTINNLTLELINEAKYYRPEIKTARNIYSVVITDPKAQEWFAQNYNDYLDLYDYVVIMAYPEMERGKGDIPDDISDEQWLNALVSVSLKNPEACQKAVFKLQGYDWNNNIWIDEECQQERISIIKNAGGLNTAQYPVNIFDD